MHQTLISSQFRSSNKINSLRVKNVYTFDMQKKQIFWSNAIRKYTNKLCIRTTQI